MKYDPDQWLPTVGQQSCLHWSQVRDHVTVALRLHSYLIHLALRSRPALFSLVENLAYVKQGCIFLPLFPFFEPVTLFPH